MPAAASHKALLPQRRPTFWQKCPIKQLRVNVEMLRPCELWPSSGCCCFNGAASRGSKAFGSPLTLQAYVSSAERGLPLLHCFQTRGLFDTAAITQPEGCTQEATTETNGQQRRNFAGSRGVPWTELWQQLWSERESRDSLSGSSKNSRTSGFLVVSAADTWIKCLPWAHLTP